MARRTDIAWIAAGRVASQFDAGDPLRPAQSAALAIALKLRGW
jgi:hypothetical protein